MNKIAIIGAGAWGTALALHAARQGHETHLVARHPERITHENPRLPGFKLPPAIHIAHEIPADAAIILFTVPTQHLREALATIPGPAPLLLCCKGLERTTAKLPLEIAAELHPTRPAAILTGPNFAVEIAAGLPAAAVIAGGTPKLRRDFLDCIGSNTFRLYGQEDAIGAQLGGAAKNVVAIAAGAVIGAGFGENARAALITRGLAEIARLAVAQGGRPETIAGLSGLGDLVLTCTSATSRNFAYGLALGQGGPLPGGTIEGLATASALLTSAPDVDLPICRVVAEVLAKRLTVTQGVAALMARPARDE